jgi:hypothetical protein
MWQKRDTHEPGEGRANVEEASSGDIALDLGEPGLSLLQVPARLKNCPIRRWFCAAGFIFSARHSASFPCR